MNTNRQKTREGSLTMVKNNKGFTLIELAVVLVIIGLILGSVLKGRDLINSAKQKNFYATFIKGWELAVATYYDRTGFLLGDGTKNGGTNATADGAFDNIIGTSFPTTVDVRLKAVGLEVPTTNTGVSGTMTYTGSNGSQTITMYLYYLWSHTDLRSSNRLYLVNVPTDLAIALDKIIDGQMNSVTGNFRRYPDNSDPTGGWPDVSTTPVVNCSVLINFP